MKFNRVTILFSFLVLTGCSSKIEISYPNCYETIQKNIAEKNFTNALDVLNSENIPQKQKIDWYYYDYAVSLYKTKPMKVRQSLSLLIIAKRFNPDSYEINYYLGKFYFDIGNYKKSYQYFSKCNNSINNSNLYFDEKITALFWQNIISYLYLDQIKKNNETCPILDEILKNNINLEELFNRSDISTEEKIYLSECYLKYNCNFVPNDFFTDESKIGRIDDSDIIDYINSKLLYKYIIENNKEQFLEILSNYNENGPNVMKSVVPFINELFYKYLAFYYWADKDGIRANNSLHIYNRYHFKPLSINDKLENNLSNIQKAFKNDNEFIYYCKTNHITVK